MFFMQIGLLVLVIFGLMAWSARAQETKSPVKKSSPTVSSQKVQSMSREDLQKALQESEAATKEFEKMGAMCYDQVAPSTVLEYICPLDGEKTVYFRGSKASALVIDISYLRNEIKKVQSLAKGTKISLDERNLCEKCMPDLPEEERTLALVIRYPDGRTVRTEDIDPDDIAHLVTYIKDGSVFIGPHHGTKPEQDYMKKRLKVLLGEKQATPAEEEAVEAYRSFLQRRNACSNYDEFEKLSRKIWTKEKLRQLDSPEGRAQQKELTREFKENMFKMMKAASFDVSELEIKDVSTQGDIVTINYGRKGHPKLSGEATLTKEGGAWKIIKDYENLQ